MGGLLYLLLFVIVMVALSRLMEKEVGGDYISGFIIEIQFDTMFMILHILFANDTLTVCGKAFLCDFRLISGLNINLGK